MIRGYTYDNMLRVPTVSYADGGLTSNTYSLASATPYMSASVKHDASTQTTSYTYFDPLGRTLTTQDAAGSKVTSSYDGNGNIVSVSTPYTGSSPTSSTTYKFDALGRNYEVDEVDGSVAKAAYSGNTVTITDEAQKKRMLVMDGLGRVKTAFEPDASGISP